MQTEIANFHRTVLETYWELEARTGTIMTARNCTFSSFHLFFVSKRLHGVFLEKLSEVVSQTELSTVLDLQLNAGFSWKMLKNNIWKFMMPIRRELVKDTLLLLAVTSLEGIRSDSESHWFITVKVGGFFSLTTGTTFVTLPCYNENGSGLMQFGDDV